MSIVCVFKGKFKACRTAKCMKYTWNKESNGRTPLQLSSDTEHTLEATMKTNP